MNENIDIWLVGNTGLRNPNRIQEGFAVFANSSFVGNLHGKENEIEFMKLLDEINKRGTTVVVVTHNREIVEAMNKRVITMNKGVIISDIKKGGYHED